MTFQNKAVPFGSIIFEGVDGGHLQGNIEKDGSYQVVDLAVGEVKVAVNSPNPKGITVMTKDANKKAESFASVPNWFAIPKQYEKVDSSGLRYTLKGGENKIDVELK